LEYPIPIGMIKGKEYIIIKFQCSGDNIAGGIFNVRLLKE